MKRSSQHINSNLNKGKDLLDRFSNGTIPWNRSRDTVWEEMESRMGMQVQPKVVRTRSVWTRFAAAAVILVLFSLTTVMRFYSRSYSTRPGEQYVLTLPDGSVANLNSSTHIKYNPYWWYISRSITLDGEAYFEVEKGEQFEVISSPGRTIVLGTSFNILSMDNQYEVTCVTGKVMVVAVGTGDEVILTPEQKATLGSSGIFELETEANTEESTAWTRGEFYFTSVPLDEVFMKIELQYGITIEYAVKESYIYTGYFKKDKQVENVLNLVCLAFGIKFENASEGVYRITQNE